MAREFHHQKIGAGWAAAVPGLDIGPMAVFGRLKHLQSLHEVALESLYDGLPLTTPEVDVLVMLRHTEQPLIARQLARMRGCSRAAIAKILTKLDDRELVSREPNPADRRAALVRITDAGSGLIDEIFPQQLAVEAALLASMDDATRAYIVTALDTLIEAMTG